MEIPDYVRDGLRRSAENISVRDNAPHLMFNTYLAEGSDDPWIRQASNLNECLDETFSLNPNTFHSESGFDIDLAAEQSDIFDKIAGFGITAIEVLSKVKRDTAKDKYVSLGQYSPEELKTMDLYSHDFKFKIVENAGGQA